jgi:sialic acid synthase SpsE
MQKNTKPFWLAEVSSNHNQNLDRCLKFIKTAADLGCDAVKFQLFKIEKLFAPEILKKSKAHRDRKAWELPKEFVPKISQKCQDCNIKLFFTPFYLKAAKFLQPYIDVYKIASYELLWDDLLKVCAQTGKPIVLSTGMANLTEIDKAIKILKINGANDITLLHCVSVYPAPINELNLKAINTMRNRYHCKVGWSDHSANSQVIYRAVQRWQASMIEFHLDIDTKGVEYQSKGYNWLPKDIKKVILNIKKDTKKTDNFTQADGNGIKTPSRSEIQSNEVDWRADPSDGLRPLKTLRDSF